MACLALLSVLNAGLMFWLLNQNQSNGKIVNYCGVVRGATQRIMKLHLLEQPVEEQIAKAEKAMTRPRAAASRVETMVTLKLFTSVLQ